MSEPANPMTKFIINAPSDDLSYVVELIKEAIPMFLRSGGRTGWGWTFGQQDRRAYFISETKSGLSVRPPARPLFPSRQQRNDEVSEPDEDQVGWAYFNEDTGHEWSRNHPIESGEVPDAMDVERMTYSGFRAQYGYDDWLDSDDQRRSPRGPNHAQ